MATTNTGDIGALQSPPSGSPTASTNYEDIGASQVAPSVAATTSLPPIRRRPPIPFRRSF